METFKSETLFTTLGEARTWVWENMTKGCVCPCCGLLVKVYRYRLNKQMVHFMAYLSDHGGRGYYRDFIMLYPQYMSKQYSLSKHWSLIAQAEKQPGYWKLTPLGLLFLKSQAQVPKYVYVSNDQKFGESPELVDVHAAYKTQFNLTETLNQQ